VRTPLIIASIFSFLLSFALCIAVPGPTSSAEPAAGGGLPPGDYTGAGQVMEIGADGKSCYDDNLSICHIEIKPDGSLEACFPGSVGNDGVHLQLEAVEPEARAPRVRWTAVLQGNTYTAFAIPFSEEAYVLRLEVLRDGKLIAGAQQFYAICKSRGVQDAQAQVRH